MSQHPQPSTSPRSTAVRIVIVAATLALFIAGPLPARARPTAQLPPKVKPAIVASHFHAPKGTTIVPGQGAARMGFCGGDDWEPEIAAAPDGEHVYVVLAHYPGDPACDPASGNPNRVYIQVSSDGGKTFGAPHVVAEKVDGVNYPSQVDCVVTVDPVTGDVYVSFLIYGVQGVKTDVAVARSTNFGKTFTAKKVNGPECRNCDHPWTIAFDGNVYTAYAHARNHYLSRSSDGGATWKETNILRKDVVAFPEGAVLDADHNAWFAWGDCTTPRCNGKTAGNYRVSRTLAGTSKTTFALVASAPAGPKCPYAPNCGFAFFGIQDDIAIDAAGTMYLVWQDGQDPNKGRSPPIVQLSRCDAGLDCTVDANWSYIRRVDDKDAQGCLHSECYALFPRVEGAAAGQIVAVWMDDRLGKPLDHTNGWNVWLRTSSTGGESWSGPSVRVSQYDPDRKESRRNGFLFPYGDYQGIDLQDGNAVMVWGEGVNYTGGPANPGHVIYRSLPI